MPRPLMQQGVGQLEALFASSKANLKVLKQLEHELQFRQVPRALALFEQVQAAVLAANTVATMPISTLSLKQQELRPQQQPVRPMEMSPKLQRIADQLTTPHSYPLSSVASRNKPSMTLDEACRLMKISPNTTWPDVERTRRELVQLSHPDRVKFLTSEKRDQVRAEAKRVNIAYSVLSTAKSS